MVNGSGIDDRTTDQGIDWSNGSRDRVDRSVVVIEGITFLIGQLLLSQRQDTPLARCICSIHRLTLDSECRLIHITSLN